MSITTQDLIQAIQSCDPAVLKTLLSRLTLMPDAFKVVNGQMDRPNDFSPMHLAAKAYAFYRNDIYKADVFDQMVSDLLEVGAVPWVEMGAKRWITNSGTPRHELGKTVVEICDGHLPPSLKRWIEGSAVGRDLSGFKINHRVLEIRLSNEPRVNMDQRDKIRGKVAVSFNAPCLIRFA